MAYFHRKNVRKKDIKTLFPDFNPDFPLHLQPDLFDVAILGTQSDRRSIEKIKILLTKFITHTNGDTIDVVTIDWNVEKAPLDFRLQEILNRATFFFLYITDEFLECSWATFMKSEAIAKAIEVDRRCVIPVFKNERKIVPGLRGIRGLNLTSLLKGKTLRDVNVETVTRTDINEFLLIDITKMVREKSYVKINNKCELEMKRSLFKEEAKLQILHETLDETMKPIAQNTRRRTTGRCKQIRPGGDGVYELTFDDDQKAQMNISQMRRRPVLEPTGEAIDFSQQGPRDISIQRANILRSTWSTECNRSRQGTQQQGGNEVHMVPVNGGRQKVLLTSELVKIRPEQPSNAGRSSETTSSTSNSRHC